MLGNEGVEENMNKEGKHKIKAWIKLHNIIISMKIKLRNKKEK